MLARQLDNIIKSSVAKDLHGPQIRLCGNCGYIVPDDRGGVYGQRNKETERDFMHYYI